MESPKPAWIKEKTTAPDFEVIQVATCDAIKDYRPDKCYVLIRLYPSSQEIGVGICTNEHVLLKEFRGKRAQDLYHAIFEYAKEHKLDWFTRLDHAAYLGKELKKAEFALALDEKYTQE
jgi:hypothetical protein|tara:strand:+ start:35862 stop:36218 length:357 start_codon:yes stop_codon:yes gene_type:complete